MNKAWLRWSLLALAVIGFTMLLANMSWWQSALHALFPLEKQVLYPTTDLLSLVARHMQLVAISSALTIIIGIPLGVWVTRPHGASFRPIVNDITSFGQTFPPVAILAIAVPMLGFGGAPTILALFFYGLLPVVRNTIAGLESVPPGAVEAAYGMGMGPTQMLLKVELPLAARLILAGIRISVIINIGTAMIGATIGAGGLGSPIVAGLVENNVSYVLEGAVPAGILAILVDRLLANIESSFAYPMGQS